MTCKKIKLNLLALVFGITCSISNIVDAAELRKEIPQFFDDVVYSDFTAVVSGMPKDQNSTVKSDKISNTGKRKLSSEDVSLTKDFSPNKGFTVIRDPDVLELLEQKGYDFYSQFSLNKIKASNLKEFISKDSNFNLIVETLYKDLSDLMEQENKVKGAEKVGVGMAFSQRLFDINWLSSEYTQFELIGVINRLDRVAFDSETCGETRFIYRLSYKSKIGNYSRLPFTMMLKYKNRGVAKTNWKTCKEIAKAWVYPNNVSNQVQLADWIISQGPLNPSLRHLQFSTAELNLQALRIPSAVRPKLAGHGTYLLRAFKLDGAQILQVSVLENTPDVTKINSNPVLKSEFIAQFKDRHFVNRLEAGTLKLDDKYLTRKAWSYSPYGIARKENRLFDQIITEKDLEAVKFDSESYVKNARAGIMRLNDMSCVGCHQARAHAGFHFLGVDKKSTHPMNALFFEGSGHFETELRRRSQYLQRVLNNFLPNPNRDFSFSPGETYGSKNVTTLRPAGFGHFCGMGEKSPFAHWKCSEGLICKNIDEAEHFDFIGKCVPEISMSGDPTISGYITQGSHNTDKLVLTSTQFLGCGKKEPTNTFSVGENKGGFPSGHCARLGCQGIKKDSVTEVCGEAAGSGFNECIYETKNGKISFTDCLERTMAHAGRGRCNDQRSCRNDYVCARSVNGEGYCTPSYFLFQVRLDGHIDPKTGR